MIQMLAWIGAAVRMSSIHPAFSVRSFTLLFIALLSAVAVAGDNVWTSNGPRSEAISALAIDPSDPQIIYAGTTTETIGGVFKSIDEGKSWCYDSDGDGEIGFNDFFLFAEKFGKPAGKPGARK